MDTNIFEQTLEKFIATGKNAMEFRKNRKYHEEEELLEFMDSLWDRMPHDRRRRAEKALRESGLDDLADLIIDGMK